MIGLLLAFSVAVTVLFAVSLTADIVEHHWAAALDDSRDAVPAAVGWAGVLIVLFAGRTAADRMFSADSHAVTEAEKQVARSADSVRRAEQRVQKHTARLATLTTGVPTLPLPGTGRHLARQVADTTARLDQARQWLASATAALATRRQEADAARDRLASDFPDAAERRRPTAGRVA